MKEIISGLIISVICWLVKRLVKCLAQWLKKKKKKVNFDFDFR